MHFEGTLQKWTNYVSGKHLLHKLYIEYRNYAKLWGIYTGHVFTQFTNTKVETSAIGALKLW